MHMERTLSAGPLNQGFTVLFCKMEGKLKHAVIIITET
jgi:hypothetical protein